MRPGATDAITGLATASVDGVPMVLISGQVPLSQIGTDAFQEADMTGICRAATKHSFLVKSADVRDLLTTVNSCVKPNARAVWGKRVARWKNEESARTPVATYFASSLRSRPGNLYWSR